MLTLWKIQNSPWKQVMLSLAFVGVGVVVLIKGGQGGGMSEENARAVMGLGLLLAVIGVPSLLTAGRQTIEVDPESKVIIVTDTRFFGSTSRRISFAEIVDVRIGYLGTTTNFVKTYYLLLQLRSGDEYPLFAPGKGYEGAGDRDMAEKRRLRLEQYLRQ